MKRLIAGVAFCGLASAIPVHAAINKCTGADGKVYFTDKPCPSKTKLEESIITPEEKREQEWQEAREKRAAEEKQRAEVNRENAKTYAQIEAKEELERASKRAEVIANWKVYEGNKYGFANDDKGGSIPGVEAALKKILKDPDSLVMESCEPVLTYEDRYRARCQYRARNSYGGYDRYTTVFYFGSDGELVFTTESTGKPLALEGSLY